jgi:NADH-quinone oxidoreductase subunit A
MITACSINSYDHTFVLLTKLTERNQTVHKTKNENFECGIDSQGDARYPISVKYFLVAILFVLFDVEVVFFYPYATNFREMGVDGFIAVLIFVAFFLCGFYYVLRKGVLDWNK